MLNPRPGGGGGVDTPIEVVCDVRRTSSSILMQFSITCGASIAQLLVKKKIIKKKIDQVMSGHGPMTSQEVSTRSGHFCEKWWTIAH